MNTAAVWSLLSPVSCNQVFRLAARPVAEDPDGEDHGSHVDRILTSIRLVSEFTEVGGARTRGLYSIQL